MVDYKNRVRELERAYEDLERQYSTAVSRLETIATGLHFTDEVNRYGKTTRNFR